MCIGDPEEEFHILFEYAEMNLNNFLREREPPRPELGIKLFWENLFHIIDVICMIHEWSGLKHAFINSHSYVMYARYPTILHYFPLK